MAANAITAGPDHDAELDALAAQLESAGFLKTTSLPDGTVEYQLTPDGASVARQLAMSEEDGQDALLAALLDADMKPHFA